MHYDEVRGDLFTPTADFHNVVVVLRVHYINTLKQALGSIKTYIQTATATDEKSVKLTVCIKINKLDFLRCIGYQVS